MKIRLRHTMMAATCAACAAFSPGWASDVPQPPSAGSSQSAEIQQMKAQMEKLQKQIDDLQTALDAEKKQLDAAEATHATLAPEAGHKAPNLGEVASKTPIIPRGIAPAAAAAVPPPPQDLSGAQASPLQIHIGDATITPVGFMDITNTYRSTNAGTSLQTNFGSIPYNNTVAGRLSEDKWSAENSRLGLRVDAKIHGANVLGYFEGDFVGGVGNGANNTQVSSNSMLFRIRQYYVDVRKGLWEVLAGQAWSMLVPNRRGLSPLPSDLFYGQVVDVNYINGLYWGRIPGVRFIAHPSSKVTFGLALENSTQYFGGSGGGGVPVLPANLASTYGAEIDNGSTNDRSLPNVHPDILAKFAVDPSARFHFEVGGVESTVKTFNPFTNQYFTKAGGAGTLALNIGVTKSFRVVTNNFYGDGAGRYLFGEAPNFIVRPDGSPSLVHSASTVSGFEASFKNWAPYVYYGGIYIDRNTAIDTTGKLIGYGFPGSTNSQNRTIQEITAGWTHTLFHDGKYGALQWMAQYAYFFRNPWSVSPGAPKAAHENVAWFNLRYVLPGTAPTVEY